MEVIRKHVNDSWKFVKGKVNEKDNNKETKFINVHNMHRPLVGTSNQLSKFTRSPFIPVFR